MIYFRSLTLFLILLLSSCGAIEFTYKNQDNLTNPVYNKAVVKLSGKEIPFIQRYISEYIGDGTNKKYDLGINIIEEKIKRSVQSNQAISKMDYNLEFVYSLKDIEKNCVVYEKSIFSNFAYVPKSDGYNFGSDESLDQMYDLATKENIGQFIGFISNKKFDCK